MRRFSLGEILAAMTAVALVLGVSRAAPFELSAVAVVAVLLPLYLLLCLFHTRRLRQRPGYRGKHRPRQSNDGDGE